MKKIVMGSGLIVLLLLTATVTQAAEKTSKEMVETGNSLIVTGDNIGAVQAYDKAIELDPQNADAYYSTSLILFSEGRNDEALAAVTKAAELDPHNMTYMRIEIYELGQLGRNDEAIQLCDKILETNSQYYPALTDKAINLEGEKKYEDALLVVNKALEINPIAIDAWDIKAMILYDLGRDTEAASADAEFKHLALSMNVYAPLSESDILAIQKWHKIGIDAYQIAWDLRRGQDKVQSVINAM